MRYRLKQLSDVLFSLVALIKYKALYGRRSLVGGFSFVGRRFDLRIRRNGSLHHGKFSSRGGLRVFCDGGRISVGSGCFFNYGCSLNAMESIEVGEGTLFGEGVKVYDHDHEFSVESGVEKASFRVKPVSIGRNCWIGSNVVILKGVVLGDNVLVGANTVVTRSLHQAGVYVVKAGLTNISRADRFDSDQKL